MSQIDALLRDTAAAVGRDLEIEARAIDRTRRALSFAISSEAATDRSTSPAKRRSLGMQIPRRATGLGLALAGVAAAAVAVALLAPGGVTVIHPSSAAAAILRHAAEAVPTEAPADPGPDQYLYTQLRESGLSAGNEVAYRCDIWNNPDHGGVRTCFGKDVHPGDAWERIGTGGLELSEWTYAQLAQLPTSTPALSAWLTQQADSGDQHTQIWIDHESWTLIHDILLAQLVPADLRVALYRVAATIPGVTSVGMTKDTAGRDALGITFVDPAEEENDELLFDPSTYLLTGDSEVDAKTGQVQEAQALIQSQIVDSIPQSVLAAAPNSHSVAGLPR